MSRPTDDASFATDATLTGGPQTGLATRLRPSDALRAQGFYMDRRPPARIMSWVLGHLGDWIAYLDNFVKVLDQGGTLLPTDNVNVLNNTGKTTNINGTVFHSAADGGAVDMTGTGPLTMAGDMSVAGVGRFGKRVGLGSAAAGVVTYAPANYDLIFLESTGAAAGTIWKIDATGARNNECIKFVYMNASFGVTIQDPSGTNIATLQFTGGNCYAVVVLKSGGSWIIVDRSFH